MLLFRSHGADEPSNDAADVGQSRVIAPEITRSWTNKPLYEPAPPVDMNPWYSSVGEYCVSGQWVYLIESIDAYKIGFTAKSARQRVAQIQAGMPTDCVLVAVREGGKELERAIQRRLRDYHKRGEWFDKCEAVPEAFYSTVVARVA
jgi:hypothetical protein